MKIAAHYRDKMKIYSPAPWPRWAVLKRDWELDRYDHKPRRTKPAPQTVQTVNKGSFTPMDRGWAEYWYRNFTYWAFGNFAYRDPEVYLDMAKKWLWLTKSTEVLCNRRGTNHPKGDPSQEYYDPVTGVNLGKEVFACDGLLMGGNIVLITGPKTRIGGEYVYPFDHLDGSQPPPDITEINSANRPDLFQRLTIITPVRLADGTYRVNPFPQLRNGYNGHTVGLNISMTQNYVPADRIKILDGYEKINPYNPPVDMNFEN